MELAFDGIATPRKARRESDHRKCVAIEATVENLEFIAQRVSETAGQCDARKKSSPADRVTFKYDETRMTPQIYSACCRYSDGDGKTRYHSRPLNPKLEGAEFEATADVAAEVLHEFWLANHCNTAEPEPDGDDAEPEPDRG